MDKQQQTSRFLHYGDDLRRFNRIVVILCVVLTAAVAILATQVGRSKFIYIDPDKIVGEAKVGYVPPKYVDLFSKYFVSTLMTAMPEDAFAAHKAAYVLMSKQLASKMKSTLEGEIETIKQGNLYIWTIPVRVSSEQTGRDNYTVKLWARKVSFSFGKPVGDKYIECQLTINKTAPKELNPFGLEVDGYDYKEVDRETAYNTGDDHPS